MIIGISGYQGTGKDTAGQVLIDKFGFTKESFAAPIKDIVSKQFNIDREMLEGLDSFSRKCREDINYGAYGFTPRQLLQKVGSFYTDNISKTFWSDIVEKKYLSTFGMDIVITDVRFPCEIEMIERNGGKVLRITREGFNGSEHSSERALEGYPFNTVQLNHGTIEEFKSNIEKLMKVWI